MEKYIQHIDSESHFAIKLLSKNQVQIILAPSSEINYKHSTIKVPNLSIPLEKEKYIIIQSDWSDTKDNWYDYYFLNISISSKPSGIKLEKVKGLKDLSITGNHFTFHLGAITQISKVILFEHTHKSSTEFVQYDAALLIILENNKKILISHVDDITGYLEIYYHEADIEAKIEVLKPRLVFKNGSRDQSI